MVNDSEALPLSTKTLLQLSVSAGFSFLGVSGALAFLCRNSSRLLVFLLRVDGLGVYLAWVLGDSSPLVSREGVKPELVVREKVKARPLLTSTWQRSRHLVARVESSLPTAVIFSLF